MKLYAMQYNKSIQCVMLYGVGIDYMVSLRIYKFIMGMLLYVLFHSGNMKPFFTNLQELL